MSKINEIAVKPCPFCGGNDFDVLIDGMIVCPNNDCLAAGPFGETMLGAVEKWNTRPQVKHLEHMIESHMNVIDKLNARIKGLEATVDELNKEISARGVGYECEHAWRQSPYDAGLTFCCLCGIERED